MTQHQQTASYLNYPIRSQGTALTSSNYQNYNNSSSLRPISHHWIAALVAGTFGFVGSSALNNALHSTSNWNITAVQKSQAENDVNKNTSIQQLELIRKVTRVSVTELARVFGVSRQAVHDWQNGSTISEKNKEAIRNFSNIINSFVKAGLEPNIQDLRRKVNGVSILDVLQSEAGSRKVANALVVTLVRENSQRTMLAERFKNRQKPQLSNEDFGAPHLADEV